MRVLALDLSINCPGWCIGDGDEYVKSGYFEQINKRAGVYTRIKFNVEFISRLVDKYKIESIWLEDITDIKNHGAANNRAVSKMLCEQQGVVKFWAHVRSIPVSIFSVTELKKFLTGKGTADKKDIVSAIQQRGYDVVNDDEADAINVWLYGLQQKAIETVNL